MDQNYYLMHFSNNQLPMILVRANWPIGEEGFLKRMLIIYGGTKIQRLIPGEIVLGG